MTDASHVQHDTDPPETEPCPVSALLVEDETTPIPYSVTPTVYGVPITEEVRAAIRTLDAALVIARRSSSGLTMGGLVGTIRERMAKVESKA